MPRIVVEDELSFPARHAESGQSLVLIALMLVLLLAFAGLAIDAGFLFARSSQFSAAVDAATLAGVVDMNLENSMQTDSAWQSADEFMRANGWNVTRDRNEFEAAAGNIGLSNATGVDTSFGYPKLDYSVEFRIRPYFLSLLGFNSIPISHSATATLYSWADLPTATQAEQGILRTAGQFITGPASCTLAGDPVSAIWEDRFSNILVANRLRSETGGIYTYRIRVPEGYSADFLDVQLFDPDSRNTRLGRGDSDAIRSDTGAPVTEQCPATHDGNRCLIPTGEGSSGNPVWLRRVDEYWKDIDPDPEDDTFFCPVIQEDDAGFETITRFELYFQNSAEARVRQGYYQSGIDRAIDEQTDMHWVIPGVDGIPATEGSFRIPSATLTTIPPDQDGYRNLYLDVSTSQGASKNGWDLWAGPPNASVPSEGNARNLYILNNLDSFSTDDIEIFAVGYLPTYTYYSSPPSIPLVSVDQSLGGHELHLRVFGFDYETTFIFHFSTMSRGDWEQVISLRCGASLSCPNDWSEPRMELELPNSVAPDPEDRDAFYGGYLMADYGMRSDDHVWHATLPLGRPFLTR